MNKKTIWITGGSTGIGKALAIKFANEGWNVAISARRENLLEEISNEMSDQLSVAKHNIDEEPNTPTKYGVRGIPTMILMKDGNHVSTKVGAVPKSEIVSWIKENI